MTLPTPAMSSHGTAPTSGKSDDINVNKYHLIIWGRKDFLNIFERSLLYSPMHSFDQKYSNIVKLYY